MNQSGLTPGIYHVPMDVYRAWPLPCAHDLTLLKQSPATLHYHRTHPDEPSQDMLQGTAVHDLWLFAQSLDWPAPPDCPKRKKEDKARHEEYEMALPECVRPLTADRREKTREMVAALNARDDWCGLRSVSQVETAVIFEYHGRLCKARPDLVCPEFNAVADLKTTRHIEQRLFQRDVYSLGYFMHAAMYLAAARIGFPGVLFDSFMWCSVAKTPPYLTRTFFADEGLLEKGDEENAAMLDLLTDCEDTESWPAYEDEPPVRISLPGWAYSEGGE